MTNKEHSTDDTFKEFCKKFGVKSTKRQVSKFKNKYGSLYKLANNINILSNKRRA
jgi:hypothetical protein